MMASSRLSSLLTSKDRDFLLASDDTKVKVTELQGNVVGIYFSANWYTPCREFNHLLIKVYEELKSQGHDFEIVLVSSDEDIGAFNNYRASMPWLSVPFSDLETRRSLSRIFDVEAIPCLVIFQPNNNDVEVHDGVELIYRYGTQSFPFTKERLDELLKEEREKEEKQTIVNLLANRARDYLLSHPLSHQVPVTSLEGKTIGLYFSAKWCLPCLKFTPKLISIYHKINQMFKTRENPEKKEFEIVFVSSDRDKTSFDTYFETMPWLALPFGDPTIKDLVKHFNVRDIPSLVIVGPDGKTVTKQGRNLINLYQENGYPFTKARLELIEKEMEEVAKKLPKSAVHAGHQHELNLVSEGSGGGPFICCDCDEQGSGWAYQCLDCGFEVHTKCVTAVQQLST
ncbi:putative nucleoredoxin 2 [Silene latifolia]|uniref:putative nucleoredoxin 2 n=1 Tax=Silene latifolia TaxID=37657 RepID=UPI003D78967F